MARIKRAVLCEMLPCRPRQVCNMAAALKRRRDARALPKLRETPTASWMNFARSALGVGGASASLSGSGFLSRASRRADFYAFAFKSCAQFACKFDGARCIAVDTDSFATHLDIPALD